MKKIYLGLLIMVAPLVGAMAQQVQLTLRVDMSQQTVSPNGVHVAGNFQALAGAGTDWNPASTMLTDADRDGIYEVQVTLPTGGLFQYKFINGNGWPGAELVPEGCGLNDGGGNINRVIDATATTTITPAYRFSSCETKDVQVPSTNYPTKWWNDAIFYEVFVRSFYDSNNDGKGDFRGLIEKLDYLNDGNPNTTTDLGITGIWLMPMMESPSYHGYDVTDYLATEQDYGSMADFDAFLAAAHARGIKVIIDFVMNHSSDQHPWFTQSSSNTTNTYRDWYIWSDTNPGFTGPAGETVWHPKNGKFYYGIFYSGMPDLNWSNAQLKSTMWDVTRFWLNKGVDGYRIDAVKYLDEDGRIVQNTPETFSLLQEFNQVSKSAKADAFLVGEAWSNSASVVPYVQNNRLDVAFEFDLASAILNSVKNNSPTALRNQLSVVNRIYPKLQYGTFLTNHDQNRAMNELGSNMAHMKQAASLYLTMPGVPFLYYGEEVGMLGAKPDEDIRKPMQWTPGANAGFSTTTPWRSINSNFAQFNVQTQTADANSLLNHYKKLIQIRNAQPALRKGYHQDMTATNSFLLGYARVFEQEAIVVVSNFGSEAVSTPSVTLPVSTLAAGNYQVTELYSGQNLGTVALNSSGSVTNWNISGGSLGADQTWILKLSFSTATGIEEETESLGLAVFPNPTSTKVTITLGEKASQRSQIQVYDVAGKLLSVANMTGSKFILETSSWSSGIYFIKVTSGELVSMKRLVVTR